MPNLFNPELDTMKYFQEVNKQRVTRCAPGNWIIDLTQVMSPRRSMQRAVWSEEAVL